MLHLENKEYDLNTLFSFEVLKEILLKLARAQVNLEEKVQNIINVYQNKENSDKDESVNYFETGENFNISEKDIVSDDSKKKDKNIENKDINLKENPEQNITKKKYDSEINTKKEETKNDIDNKNDTENKNVTDNKKEDINKKENTKKKEDINKKDIDNKSDQSDKNENVKVKENKKEENEIKEISKEEINNVGVSPDLIKNMLKLIKQNKSKISELENENNILKKKFKSHESNNKKDIDEINKKLNELSKRVSEYEEKLDNIESKCTDIDVLSMFKDNGDGTIDATKVMVKALEEKVFKKIEMVENKNKMSYLNDKMELILSKIEKDRQNIEKLYNLTGKNKELIDELKNELNQKTKEMNDENLNNLNKKLKDLKDKLSSKINELNEKIENQMKQIEELKKKNLNNDSQLFKFGLNENQVDKEAIDDINLKINDLRKKVNDIENSLKLYLDNNKIEELDNQIKNMNLILDKKISKEDLKELYNLHLSDLDEINDTNNKILSVYDQVKKNNLDIQGILKKIDTINSNISLLQNYMNSGNMSSNSNQPIIDFSKFIDNQKLTDTIKPLIKEMEKMFQEIYSLRRELNDQETLNKEFIKQIGLDQLEEKLTDKITDLKTSFQKKFLDKAEHYKAIKNLEALIKVQVEENRKDADSWLMAKQPLKCFNCATCESNIKNITPSNEYLPWNKYPPGDRIYRMGQGFSHMLQMMTNEFIKNIEKNTNEIHNDNEQHHRNMNLSNINDNKRINTLSNNSEKGLLGLSVNNKQQYFEDSPAMQRKSGKIRLPIMSKYIKSRKIKNTSDIPVSDDEREKDYNEMFDKIKLTGSPKIVKIMKKKTAFPNMFGANEIYENNINTENNVNQNIDVAKSLNYKS